MLDLCLTIGVQFIAEKAPDCGDQKHISCLTKATHYFNNYEN